MSKKQTPNKYNDLWANEVHKCSKCGKCRAFCPVFLETRDEKMGTRGRISLADALITNRIELTPEFVRSISTCMRCLRCVKECPSKVDFDKLIRGLKGVLSEEVPAYKAAKGAIRSVLLNRWILDALAFAAFCGQKVLPGGRNQWVKKIPFFYRGSHASPRFSRVSALKKYAGGHAVKDPRYRVLLYVGCVINYLYPEIAEAVIDVLGRFNVEVIVSDKELCCGIPALSSGDNETARRLARKNIDVAAKLDVDYIISACGTCVSTFKRDYEELLGDESKEFSGKVIDVSCFIKDVLNAEFPRMDAKVTYHDPCHLKFGVDVTKEPRCLLSEASDFIEMEDADKCCGMAGGFGIMNYDLAKKMFLRKAQAVRKSGAEIVATGCPSCIMQIKGQLHDHGIDVEVMHTAELLKKSLDSKKEKDES
ncbi:(Fe-S)-binding protein [Candidatus Auribacterota bacterium]